MTTVHSAGVDLLERLGGSGAMVHRAVVRATGRVVVVKHAHWDRPDVTERLGREAAVLRRVRHASLVRLVEQVDDENGRYLLLAHAPGGSLADLVAAGGRLPASQVADVGARLAAALSALHAAGVVHRDVHPGNVLLDAELQPLLADLDNALDTAGPELPGDRQVVGHPDHVDHRVLAGAVASPTSDLHGLATTLWTLATGTPPRRRAGAGPVELPAHRLVPRVLHELLVACVTLGAGDAAAIGTRLHELATRLAQPLMTRAADPGDAMMLPGHDVGDRVVPPVATPEDRRPPTRGPVAVTGGDTRRWGPRPVSGLGAQASRPAGSGRDRRIVAATIVAALVGLATWWWGGPTVSDAELAVVPPTPCSDVTVDVPGQHVLADLDGDGCAEVLRLAGGELDSPSGRYLVGEPGDVLLAGDWDGDGRWGIGLYRPATGVVLLIDEPGPGATSRPAQQHPAGGVPVVVQDGDHHRVRIDPA